MKFIRIILFPLVPIYYIVTWLRNIFYDIGWLTSKAYKTPVICVGNLSTGGTGKTPMVEYLIRHFRDNYRVATLSRGYKRKTQGFLLANESIDAGEIGDEPYQYYLKFPEIVVAVDEDRQNGIAQLLELNPSPEIILLDDAYQHRKVRPGFTILLTSYMKPYFKDMVLPTGNLREPRLGSRRADVIVVTKCPNDLDMAEKQIIKSELNPLQSQEVFFSQIRYSATIKSDKDMLPLANLPRFTLVTGIANPQPLKDYLIERCLEFDHIEFPDHHFFRPDEIKRLAEKSFVLTTEKDYVRLKNEPELKGKLYYVPITFEIDRAEVFSDLLNNFLTKEA